MKRNKTLENRYFIALVPPEPILSETQALKNEMTAQFATKGAQNAPPHITLHMPFRLKPKKEIDLLEKLEAFAATQQKGTVTLSNFAAFPPRVIYVDVIKNDFLEQLQSNLEKFMKVNFQQFNANHKDHGFTPHLTIAFRDLKKPAFFEAWEVFQNREYHATWEASAITLLKHDGKRWQHFKNFDLATS